MASILKALKKTLKFEGVYSDDPDDLGGETYYGISRVNHPNWEGWPYIDKGKQPPVELVPTFYKKLFWNKMGGDDISSQGVAENIFDFAVNAGLSRAIKAAQRAANICTLYRNPDSEILLMDGVYGPQTERVIASIGADSSLFEFYYLTEVANHYAAIIFARRKNAKFARGWANRTVVKLTDMISRWNG